MTVTLAPGGYQRSGVALEQEAVGGYRQVLDAIDPRQHRNELRKLPAHQWFAAGETHVVNTHTRKQSDQPGDLLESQDLCALEPGQAVGRHAVLTAKVAAIGDRHAQIGDATAMAVKQRFGHHHQLPRYYGPSALAICSQFVRGSLQF